MWRWRLQRQLQQFLGRGGSWWRADANSDTDSHTCGNAYALANTHSNADPNAEHRILKAGSDAGRGAA